MAQLNLGDIQRNTRKESPNPISNLIQNFRENLKTSQTRI